MKHKYTVLWVLSMLFDIAAVICSITVLTTGHYRLSLLTALLVLTGTTLTIIDTIRERKKR